MGHPETDIETFVRETPAGRPLMLRLDPETIRSGCRPRVAILDDWEGMMARASATAELREMADVVSFHRHLNDDEVRELAEYDIAIAIRERTHFTASLLRRLPKLELLVQTGNHAYHIDLQAATRQGLIVALDPNVNASTSSVSELTFGLAIGLLRNLTGLTSRMASGEWPNSFGRSLHGRTLGILGLGRQGSSVARMGLAFGMRVLAWGPTLTRERALIEGVEYIELDELLRCADVVTIHLRLSDKSRGLLDRRRIGLMRPDSILINTARGEIVDEVPLVEALAAGRLAGAGLDVYSQEPLDTDSPLRDLQNVVLTPHIGWTVEEVFDKYSRVALNVIHSYLQQILSKDTVLNTEAVGVERPRRGGLEVA